MKKVRRKSKQRDIIYELIKNNSAHPTAQWIYDRLRQEFPTLSMGNVYRNLNILIEEGLIKSSEFGDSIVHYDAILENHYHFICEKCRSITDFSIPIQKNILKKAQEKTKNQILSYTIEFFGICEKCKKG